MNMHRTTIDFGPDQAEALDRLVEQEGQTKAAIVRRSLAIYLALRREERAGRAIASVDGEKIVKQFVLSVA